MDPVGVCRTVLLYFRLCVLIITINFYTAVINTCIQHVGPTCHFGLSSCISGVILSFQSKLKRWCHHSQSYSANNGISGCRWLQKKFLDVLVLQQSSRGVDSLKPRSVIACSTRALTNMKCIQTMRRDPRDWWTRSIKWYFINWICAVCYNINYNVII